MANMLLLKRRRETARNVSKTTRAMQMIAASKMRRAQETALASRPYVEKLTLVSKNLSQYQTNTLLHPYMNQHFESGKTLLIVVAPDKGLCGGLVTNLLREYLTFADKKDYVLITIGKKVETQVARSVNALLASFPFGTILPTFNVVYPLTTLIDEQYLSGKVDSVKILYTHFSSIFSQKPVLKTLLPLSLSKEELQNADTRTSTFGLFEPSTQELVPPLLKRYLEMTLYQYLLENYVSEQAARMIAMQNATDNAKDIIEGLTLEYNKARQAKITSEILDITGATAGNYATS